MSLSSDTQACSLVVPSRTPNTHTQLSSQTQYVLNLLLLLHYAWLGPGLCLTHMSLNHRLLDWLECSEKGGDAGCPTGQKHVSDTHGGLCGQLMLCQWRWQGPLLLDLGCVNCWA